MRYSNKSFDEAVWQTVASIKPGHVMSYGEVARAAGFPRHARMVSKAMGRSPGPLPWHRVVRTDRTLAFAVNTEAYNRQKRLLEQEGAKLENGKVIALGSEEVEDLDKLIWGPPDI
jgi:methylated-DNA-protein-cysteine methyltransferase-like protein